MPNIEITMLTNCCETHTGEIQFVPGFVVIDNVRPGADQKRVAIPSGLIRRIRIDGE